MNSLTNYIMVTLVANVVVVVVAAVVVVVVAAAVAVAVAVAVNYRCCCCPVLVLVLVLVVLGEGKGQGLINSKSLEIRRIQQNPCVNSNKAFGEPTKCTSSDNVLNLEGVHMANLKITCQAFITICDTSLG